jgi:hypothetical protein
MILFLQNETRQLRIAKSASIASRSSSADFHNSLIEGGANRSDHQDRPAKGAVPFANQLRRRGKAHHGNLVRKSGNA